MDCRGGRLSERHLRQVGAQSTSEQKPQRSTVDRTLVQVQKDGSTVRYDMLSPQREDVTDVFKNIKYSPTTSN